MALDFGIGEVGAIKHPALEQRGAMTLRQKMRVMIVAALVLASGCANTSAHPGWTGHNAPPFENTVARCQIETQTVDGPDFERCMASLGWTRERG